MNNEIFTKDEFAIQTVASGTFYDDDGGFNGKTYAVATYVVRLNHIAQNEWIFSSPLPGPWDEWYGTEAEYLAEVEARKKRRSAFEHKVREALGIVVGSCSITQNVSEIFTVVNMRQL